MRIAFMEPFPILEEELRRILRKTPYSPLVFPTRAKKDLSCEIAVSDQGYFPPNRFPLARIFLIPGEAGVQNVSFPGTLLTGGMSQWDDVIFTSIGEEHAMICLQKEITVLEKNIVPFEMRVPYDRRFRLYKNLALGFCLAITQILFGEEL